MLGLWSTDGDGNPEKYAMDNTLEIWEKTVKHDLSGQAAYKDPVRWLSGASKVVTKLIWCSTRWQTISAPEIRKHKQSDTRNEEIVRGFTWWRCVRPYPVLL